LKLDGKLNKFMGLFWKWRIWVWKISAKHWVSCTVWKMWDISEPPVTQLILFSNSSFWANKKQYILMKFDKFTISLIFGSFGSKWVTLGSEILAQFFHTGPAHMWDDLAVRESDQASPSWLDCLSLCLGSSEEGDRHSDRLIRHTLSYVTVTNTFRKLIKISKYLIHCLWFALINLHISGL